MSLVIDALTAKKEVYKEKINVLNKLECQGISDKEYIAIGFAIAVIDGMLTEIKKQITDEIIKES